MNFEPIIERLLAALKSYEKIEIETAAKELTQSIYNREFSFPIDTSVKIISELHKKRQFSCSNKLLDALILSGQMSLKIKKYYAQSLIELGQIHTAISYLKAIANDHGARLALNTSEYSEADCGEIVEIIGLLGRAYKQAFVIFSGEKGVGTDYLKKAIRTYLEPYKENPKKNYWHGINYVALLGRAKSEKVALGINISSEMEYVANEILINMRNRWDVGEASLWDSCTAMEACIALKITDEARLWVNRYLREPKVDAFELASTLRQIEEIWQLTANDEPGKTIVPLLKAELLQKEGGGIVISKEDIVSMESNIDTNVRYEKAFSEARYHSYSFMQKAINNAHNVGRIEIEPDKGFGTGFLVDGGALHSSFDGMTVLLTNSHVISDKGNDRNTILPEEATVTFELGENSEEYELEQVLWTSSPDELDASVVSFRGPAPSIIHPLKIHKKLPIVDGKQRVYVIGHPGGLGISFSMQDNVLLDHESHYIHYRAATEGGSSGSPVFNRQWKLIGIHHAGGNAVKKLNGKKGTYQANEGIWIHKIISQLKADLG